MGSSIPLPALDIRTPAQPDVLGNLARIQQIKQAQAMAPLQQQEAQQAVQSGALDIQKKQIAVKDEQAMQAAMQEWGKPKGAQSSPPQPAQVSTALPGQSSYGMNAPQQQASAAPSPSAFNLDELVPLAIKNGASFNAVKGLQTSILDMKAKAATIAMDDARAGSSNAETLKTKNSMIIDALTGALSVSRPAITSAGCLGGTGTCRQGRSRSPACPDGAANRATGHARSQWRSFRAYRVRQESRRVLAIAD